MIEVSEILKTINSTSDGLPTDLKEEDRLALLTATSKLQEKLESPLEAFLRFMFGVLCSYGCVCAILM